MAALLAAGRTQAEAEQEVNNYLSLPQRGVRVEEVGVLLDMVVSSLSDPLRAGAASGAGLHPPGGPP